MAATVIDVTLVLSKITIGKKPEAGDFEFELLDESGGLIQKVKNDGDGFVVFKNVRFTTAKEYNYKAKEVSGPGGWVLDDKEYSVKIVISAGGSSGLVADVSYPDGVPGFLNAFEGSDCGQIKFPDLQFDAPGEYEFFLKEETASGGGWETDPKTIKVVAIVVDDGYGNLVATVAYPEEYPEFTNIYKTKSVKVVISACKKAVGAPLPAGRFEFGLYDKDGKLIAKVKNGAVKTE